MSNGPILTACRTRPSTSEDRRYRLVRGVAGPLFHHPQELWIRTSGERVLDVPGSVLDLLAGLPDVGLGLVALALGLEVLVVRGLAVGLLDLADCLIGLVLELVVGTHRG